jgi:hypothetical protein
MRTRLRRLGFGLSTVLGLGPFGFFIPYRYAGSAAPADYPALRPLFAAAEPACADVLSAIELHGDDLLAIAAAPGPARFDQDWFPRLDAAAAYALVRRELPRRIVEVGSGHSTRFLARAVADGGLATQITCIDPAPRAGIAELGIRHEPRLVGDVDPVLFGQLQAGDVLFIDSSHVAMPGTDVDRLFLEILPRLAAGVLLHVHDVFLPDAYPSEWIWRGYNEQLVAGALIQGGAWEIVFASRYLTTQRPELISSSLVAHLPLMAGAHESSLWLRKR